MDACLFVEEVSVFCMYVACGSFFSCKSFLAVLLYGNSPIAAVGKRNKTSIFIF